MEKSLLKHLAERKTENIFLFSENFMYKHKYSHSISHTK